MPPEYLNCPFCKGFNVSGNFSSAHFMRKFQRYTQQKQPSAKYFLQLTYDFLNITPSLNLLNILKGATASSRIASLVIVLLYLQLINLLKP
jgi:hypothetical protein